MNQIQIVGNLAEKPRKTNLGSVRYSSIVIDVTANFRDGNGVFKVNQFQVYLWKGIHDDISICGEVGQPLAIKGRIEVVGHEFAIIAEHVELLFPK